MEQNSQNLYQTHLFICELCQNPKAPHDDPKALRKNLKGLCKDQAPGASIRINGASCLGACERGINAVLYPEGQWFHGLQEKDVEFLAQTVLEAHQAREKRDSKPSN